MTNGIKVGDTVQIVGTFIIGRVMEIDDHPFEYAQLRLKYVTAAGEVEVWHTTRLARKIQAEG